MFGQDDDHDNQPATDDQAAKNDDWQHPGTPVSDDSSDPVVSPAGGFPRPTSDQLPAGLSDAVEHEDKPADDKPPKENSGDLLEIRRLALNDLQPLMDKLDMPPEEKYKTLMMMIQSTDNQSLLDTAYRAAHDIKNDKERAEALLDIVNEINYFTQGSNN